MSVPTYDQFIEPVLRHLAAHPDGAAARDVHEAAASALHLSDTDRVELLAQTIDSSRRSRNCGAASLQIYWNCFLKCRPRTSKRSSWTCFTSWATGRVAQTFYG